MTIPDPMAEIRASFFIECEELLESIQDGLEALAENSTDLEAINVVFRAVHSIKGGAGAFGLEALVRFAHRFEAVMDAVRSGALTPNGDMIKLFFRCADHLSDLVRGSRDETELPASVGQQLIGELDGYDGGAPDDKEEEIEFQPLGISLKLPGLEGGDDLAAVGTTVLFAPHADFYGTGNEPLMLLRNLSELGPCHVTLEAANLPSLENLAPESSYLSWTVSLESEANEAEVTSIFEFVDGLCDLKIGTAAAPATAMPDLPDLLPLKDIPKGAELVNEEKPSSMGLPIAPIEKAQAPPAPTQKAEVPKANAESSSKASATTAKSVIRVDLDRIERLINLVGELVINQAMLQQSLDSAGLSPHSDAMHGLEEFQRLTQDIQDSVMMIRAQPVKPLFQRMSRIVREASAAVGKDVVLVTEGETTEIDKTVIERLADPLTHMIRNAVDHGLENTEDRKTAGKDSQGKVRLTAAHRSGRVIIEVSDDGGGINRPKVQQVAINKGLIPADVQLSDTEVDNLLFLPGFSTTTEVSDLSGRGVGMDVVRTAIQALGGRISISSDPGVGTTFSISLPLTLAVLDGMVVNVAGETLVLPLNLIVETLTIDETNLDRVRQGQNVIRVRGSFVPLSDLGVELGYRPMLDDYVDRAVLLIALENGNRAALVVDEIHDQRQVVIKGLDESFCRTPGIAAATILGDGQIALILDPSDIIAHTQFGDQTGMPARKEASQ